jgi:DNA replication protein DnaC
VDKALIVKLADLPFTQQAQSAVLIGGPEAGKTHLATALGISGLTHHGKGVRFYSRIDLVNALEQEKTLVNIQSAQVVNIGSARRLSPQ